MKTVYVNNQEIQLNNVKSNATLTPSLVRSALRIATGNTRQHAIVHDSNCGYKVTPSRIRRMKAVELFDAGIGE